MRPSNPFSLPTADCFVRVSECKYLAVVSSSEWLWVSGPCETPPLDLYAPFSAHCCIAIEAKPSPHRVAAPRRQWIGVFGNRASMAS